MKFSIATAFTDPQQLCELAVAADEHGWDWLSVSDHVVNYEEQKTKYPYTDDGSRRWETFTPWPDPWVAIGAMAAVTQRIRFFTSIYVLPMRNPFWVAKAVGTAAVMSNDRVALGIGVGWCREEFEIMEQDFRTRGKRTDEMFEVLRKLWSGEMVEHRGTHYAFDRLEMNPAPAHAIPIFVGGISDPAFRRAATLGDGWISDLHSTEELRGIAARLHELRRDAGRENEPFEIIASANDAFDVDGYRRLEDAGVTTLATMPWMFYAGANATLSDKKDGIRRFADEVIAKM